MAQDANEGVSYLLALRRLTTTQAVGGAAAAAAPARELSLELAEGKPSANASFETPSSQDQYQGTEKRRSARYKCEGSAEMRAEGCDVRTWATFTDISLHGCYVEVQATYPAGTVLHMKLDANGNRVETKGKVRVTYPYLGMGIAFEEMSEDNRTRLRELLGTVSQPSMIMGPGIASVLPSSGPMEAVPLISDPKAGIQALISFFEDHHMLTRDDFLSILRKSQG
jgi:hypothetical protein